MRCSLYVILVSGAIKTIAFTESDTLPFIDAHLSWRYIVLSQIAECRIFAPSVRVLLTGRYCMCVLSETRACHEFLSYVNM